MKLPEPWKVLWELPSPLWRLALAQFVNRCGTMVIAFLGLYFAKAHGLPLTTAGWLVASYSWGSLAAAPAAAWLCERWDACRVLQGSLLGAGGLMLLFPQLEGVPAWAVGCFLLGLISELGRPAGYTALGRMAPPDRLRQSYTLNRLAVNLGMAVGPALGGLIAQRSYLGLFWVDGISSLLAGLTLMGLNSGLPSKETGPSTRLGPLFYRYLLGHFLGMLVFCQIFVALPLYLVKGLGLPESSTGWLFSLNTLLILLIEAWITHLTRNWVLTYAIATGYLLQGLGLGAMGLGPEYALAVAGVVFFTLGEMLQCAANSTYLNLLAGGRLLGRANAWFVGCGSLAFILTPPLVGWVLEHRGAPALWAGIACLGVVSALWVLTLPRQPSASLVKNL